MLEQEDRFLQICFGGRWTSLVSWPHLICKRDVDVIDVLADIVGTPMGLWGDELLGEQDGETCFLNPLDGETPFYRWSTSENQKLLREKFNVRVWPHFRMLIDSSLHLDDLGEIWPADDAQLDDTFGFTARVPLVIEKLGWTFITLTEGHPLAMLVTLEKRVNVLQGLEKWCNEKRRPSVKLKDCGDRVEWIEQGSGDRTLIAEMIDVCGPHEC